MDQIPSHIIFEIFSRVPARCLARSRCVSTVWCKNIDDRYLTIIHNKRVVDEPTPILYHRHHSHDTMTTRSLCFHVTECKQPGTTHYVLEPKEGPFLEYLLKKPLSKSARVKIQVQGCCNGLMCLLQDDGEVVTSLVVVHPLRKECYDLPPFPLQLERHMRRKSCGLGFDAFTNTWKMVCVLLKEYAPPDKPDMVKKNLCTMVHVFGTNSWREIPQVPSYPIAGKAVFANGCLHWLVSYIDMKIEDGACKRPSKMCDLWRNYSCYNDQLVNLNGEVGYVCSRTMEVWVLKAKEWVPHCWFEKHIIPDGYIEVLGCWNKDGDMLIINRSHGRYAFFIYNLKSGVLHNTNVAGAGLCPGIFMYPNTLSSIRGISKNSFSLKKTDVKKNCRDLLSFC